MNIKFITYIDDNIDSLVSKYIRDFIENIDETQFFYTYNYGEIIFKNQNYMELLNNTNVLNAGIIIIDSGLFENNNKSRDSFTGEEFKLLLRKTFPFIEVIIITKNKSNYFRNYVEKFTNKRDDKNYDEYYDEYLLPEITKSLERVEDYKLFLEKLKESSSFDKYIKEQIDQLYDGISIYPDLTKEDIDNIAVILNEINEKVKRKDE